MERIAVIGTGYVGLVAGAVLASNGHRVICADVDERKIAGLKQGEVPIYEPGLESLVRAGMQSGALSFTTDVSAAVRESTISLIAVGTPSKPDGSFDGTYILSAAKMISDAAKGAHLVVIKSTVDPTLYDEAQKVLKGLDLAVNPEFMAEGTAVQDFAKPNRVIIGTTSQRARDVLSHIYRDLVKSDPQSMLFMHPHSAIVTKLASNAALAMKVTFINEVARFCEAVGADVEEVRLGMSRDPRIGRHFLYAGPGYGGSCFPKDVQALTAASKRLNLRLSLISTVEPSNEEHKRYLPNLIERELGSLKGVTVAVWGLAFKAGTDDIRDSAAIAIAKELIERGAKVQAHDPQAMEHAKRTLSATFCETKEKALKGARALVILTEWSQYKNPDLTLLKGITVFDGRNILDPKELAKAGISYKGIGRKAA